jgi:serine/threonine protein kinase
MLPLNTTLQGRYQIVAQIGRGGMGAVYKAIDTRLRNTVALKQTLLEGEIARRAFEREAQLLAGMRHPALPKVSDHFTDELGQFLVMEFISGEDLGTMLLQRGEPFGVEEVLSWGDRLLDALEYLHTHNPPIVHRDIKPQNMKLTDRGEIILLDFGLAKGSSSAQATRSASTGSIFGYTPHYAPLEQIQGTGTGPRSDLYALSATLYNLLTGSPPPDALTRAAARINDEPDPLQLANQLNPEVPQAVATVLYQAMAQKPDQRPENAAAMRRMLRDAARGTMPVTIRFPEPVTGETVVAQRPGTAGLPTIGGQIANGTTINQPQGTASTKLLPGSNRPAWLFPAIGGGAVAILLAVLFATGVFGGGGKSPTATPVQSTPAVVAAIATPASVATPEPTVDFGSAVEQTIVARETATVAVAASQTAVIQAFIENANGTNTAVAQATIDSSNNVEKTALAETAAVIALTPTSTIAPPTNTRGPTNTPRPTATRDPNAPTATIRPTATPKAPETPTLPPPPPGGKAAILAQGGGTEFRGSASVGTIDAASGDGGSCIQGSVTAKDGSFFNSFLVGIDQGGRPTKVNYNYGSGFFGACGLSAGEWGIVVYKAGNKDTNPGDQGQHQVRIRLSGTPGEVVYVKFRANEFDVPQPTATPLPSPYDGQWSGTISGKTAGDQDFTGRFRMEVRGNAIYRISIDGPSCLFETYPNVEIADNTFATGGSPTNPATGTDSSIQYTITGSFSSASRASGRANANQNGGTCIVANWSASK